MYFWSSKYPLSLCKTRSRAKPLFIIYWSVYTTLWAQLHMDGGGPCKPRVQCWHLLHNCKGINHGHMSCICASFNLLLVFTFHIHALVLSWMHKKLLLDDFSDCAHTQRETQLEIDRSRWPSCYFYLSAGKSVWCRLKLATQHFLPLPVLCQCIKTKDAFLLRITCSAYHHRIKHMHQ